MTFTIPHHSAFALVDCLRDQLGGCPGGTCGLAQFDVPPRLGHGYFYVQQWGSDNYHLYCSASFLEEVFIELPATDNPNPQSVAVVSGSMVLDIGNTDVVETLEHHTSCVFRPGPGQSVCIKILPGDSVKVSFIHFGKILIDELRPYLCDSPVEFLFDNSAKRDKTLISCGSNSNYAVSELLLHTFDSGLSGLSQNAYTHGKTLLIIGEQLKLAEAAGLKEASRQDFSSEEIRQLLRSKAVLDSEYASDLTIAKLARIVGVNQQKLKSGFKGFFNVTISKYLRGVRIKMARRMFDTGRWTVGEVANMVGYTNQSHFAARFREEVGISPSRYLRQPRQHSLGLQGLKGTVRKEAQ